MDATTVARVKDLLEISHADHDTVLGRIVSAVSSRIETFLDRKLQTVERTEEYTLKPRQRVIFLRAYPLTTQASVSSVKVAPSWDYAAAAAYDSDSYRVDLETGTLYLPYSPVQHYLDDNHASSPLAAQVVYTAGMGVDTNAFVAAYPDIAYAADTQSVAMWRRRDSPQGKEHSIRAGSMSSGATYEAPLNLVPDVIEALTPYRRLRFGANS